MQKQARYREKVRYREKSAISCLRISCNAARREMSIMEHHNNTFRSPYTRNGVSSHIFSHRFRQRARLTNHTGSPPVGVNIKCGRWTITGDWSMVSIWLLRAFLHRLFKTMSATLVALDNTPSVHPSIYPSTIHPSIHQLTFLDI